MLNRCFVYVFVVLIFLVAIRCTDRLAHNEIEKSWWKYGSGLHLGDVLRFDDSNLKGDTIYRNKQPVAIVIACERKVLENSAVLKLKSIHNEKTDRKSTRLNSSHVRISYAVFCLKKKKKKKKKKNNIKKK